MSTETKTLTELYEKTDDTVASEGDYYKDQLDENSSQTSAISDPNSEIKKDTILDELKKDLKLEEIGEFAKDLYNTTKNSVITGINATGTFFGETVPGAIADGWNYVKENSDEIATDTSNVLSPFVEKLGNIVGKGVDKANSIISDLQGMMGSFSEYLTAGSSTSSFMGTLGGIASAMADSLVDYQDGVTETQFGSKAEASWKGDASKSFLDYFSKQNKSVSAESRKINFLNSTPLDSGSERTSLFGSMMLGTPFLFNEYSDPTNRTLINSLVKDGRYVSFTPGLPKFNGTSYNSSAEKSILNQTSTPTAMLNYLTRNGIDMDFANKDKRYYTFEAKYKEYFAYLETMLNVVWIKMGLAKNGQTFNLFTFFDINKQTGIETSGADKLLERYNSSIGFFANISNAVSESISNSPSSDGDNLAQRANQNAQEYQALNYMTGMGTGGSVNNLTRKIGIGVKGKEQLKGLLGESLSGTLDAIAGVGAANTGGIAGLVKTGIAIAKVPIALAMDITTFNNTNDLGAVIQSFATSNGMMVRYPNMWADSVYSKNINFNFSFTSPYGDPLSVFKYVYVPFFAILAMALPRQAAENGLVSPFLVRCDAPGVVTSDLALISDVTWTKGGANNLWTKDGLPRSIDVTVTVSDLYPYLAMSKRISFLSANPSYAVFLDNLSGMLALNDSNEDDALNSYFKELLNRVNGLESKGNSMWNKFNSKKSAAIKDMSEKIRASLSATVDVHSIPWMHNSKAY